MGASRLTNVLIERSWGCGDVQDLRGADDWEREGREHGADRQAVGRSPVARAALSLPVLELFALLDESLWWRPRYAEEGRPELIALDVAAHTPERLGDEREGITDVDMERVLGGLF